MLNRKVAAVVLAVLVVAASAFALEINSKYVTEVAPSGAVGTFEWSGTSIYHLPSSFTIWSGDAAKFWITFYPLGVAESFSLPVPAGRSITMPTPPPSHDGTNWTTKFTVAGHTDSVFVMGWGQ